MFFILCIQCNNLEDVFNFLYKKGITCTNHLLTGSPASTVLSYLVNHRLFDTLYEYASKNSIIMSVYIDDIVFSSNTRIPNSFRKKVLHLIKMYDFNPSKDKTKYYTQTQPKLVTGVILSNHELKVPNKLRRKAIQSYANHSPGDVRSIQVAKGVLNSARQIEPEIFPSFSL